jgi:hypothetical protein
MACAGDRSSALIRRSSSEHAQLRKGEKRLNAAPNLLAATRTTSYVRRGQVASGQTANAGPEHGLFYHDPRCQPSDRRTDHTTDSLSKTVTIHTEVATVNLAESDAISLQQHAGTPRNFLTLFLPATRLKTDRGERWNLIRPEDRPLDASVPDSPPLHCLFAVKRRYFGGRTSISLEDTGAVRTARRDRRQDHLCLRSYQSGRQAGPLRLLQATRSSLSPALGGPI